MNYAQNKEYTLQQITKSIVLGDYQVPLFQREFVWLTAQIEKLGDSLIRGYPIGSMVIMEPNSALHLQSEPLRTKAAKVPSEKYEYVLDGQQRLTSIAEIFCGGSREYFFDLLAILQNEFKDGVLQNSERFKEIEEDLKATEIDEECVCLSWKPTENAIESRENDRFVSARVALEERTTSFVFKFVSQFKDVDQPTREKWINRLTSIFSNMINCRIAVSEINRNASFEFIIRMFETVNNTGVKLSSFDLVHAKSFQVTQERFMGGLTRYLEEQIFAEAEGKNKDAILSFFGKSELKNGKIKLDELMRFLRCAAFADDFIPHLKNGKRVAPPQHSDILGKTPDTWFLQWEKHGKILIEFLSMLADEGLMEFGNKAFIEYMSGIVLNRPYVLKDAIFMKAVKKQIISYALTAKNFRRVDLPILNDFIDLSDVLKTSHALGRHNEHKVFRDMSKIEISAENFQNIGFKSLPSQAALQIIYGEHYQNLGSVDILGNPTKSCVVQNMEKHHLFPKATTKADGHLIFNSIGNIAPLTNTDNRAIADKLPSEYLKTLREKYPKQSLINEKSNLMEGFSEPQYDNNPYPVVRDRLDRMVAVIQDYFKP
jgi:Protein of unknown function DUF262